MYMLRHTDIRLHSSYRAFGNNIVCWGFGFGVTTKMDV